MTSATSATSLRASVAQRQPGVLECVPLGRARPFSRSDMRTFSLLRSVSLPSNRSVTVNNGRV
eukprot:1623924-Prymnesium_polylepis.1